MRLVEEVVSAVAASECEAGNNKSKAIARQSQRPPSTPALSPRERGTIRRLWKILYAELQSLPEDDQGPRMKRVHVPFLSLFDAPFMDAGREVFG